MAQSASNLTIGIGIDTSKLKADLRVLSTQLKGLGKELDAAVKSGNAAEINKTSAAYQNLLRQSAGLTNQLKSQTAATHNADSSLKEFIHSGRGLGRVVGEFSNFSRGLESATGLLGVLTGGFTGGLLGVAVARGFDALLGQLDELSKRLTAIQQQARQAGVAPLAVQAAGEAAKQAGLDAEAGEKGFTSFAKAVAEARAAIPREDTRGPQVTRGISPDAVSGAAVNDAAKGITAMDAASKEASGSVRVLRGNVADTTTQIDGMGKVLRGGVRDLKDFSDPLKVLGIDVSRIKPEDMVKTYELAIKRLLELAKQFPSQMNVVAQKLFAMPLADIQEIAKDADSLQALIAKLSNAQAGATDKRLAENKELKKAQNELSTAWEELGATIANAARPGQIAFDNLQKQIVEGLIPLLEQAGENFRANFGEEMERSFTNAGENFRKIGQMIESAWSSLTQSMTSTWSTMWTSITDATTSAVRWIVDQFNKAKNAVAAASSTLSTSFPGDPSIPAMPAGDSGGDFGGGGDSGLASGGLVRGRGTGTSDSILARLSNGEFVMRAAAVRQLGVGFLRGLNGFAAGGFIGMPTPRFASGGLVSATAASGGRPVHLHLGGNSFALSGNDSVVGALVTEAHRQRMRSAGVKPSWYGGH